MYREKLISQIEVFENAQARCDEVHELITLSRNILDIAKKIDELDENTEVTVSSNIMGETVYEAVRKANDEYRQKRTASPFETMEQAIKEALEEISD